MTKERFSHINPSVQRYTLCGWQLRGSVEGVPSQQGCW